MRSIIAGCATRVVSCLAVAVQLGAAHTLLAQSIPGAVLAAREPHHHLAYEDSGIRVLRVRVPPHDSTLLHEHDPDYFWIALGASDFVNARLGAPDAVAHSADLAVHYAPGKFAHVARNPGASPFDNITVELLDAQTNVRNLCEAAIADRPLACPDSAEASGVGTRPAFETDQLRVSLVTIRQGAVLHPVADVTSTWVIALDTADARHALAISGDGRWRGGTFRAPNRDWSVQNRGDHVVRVLTLERRSR